MKTTFAIALFCALLAGCNQGRRVERDESEVTSPVENQRDKVEDSLDRLLRQVKQEIAINAFDDARITLHQVFRRDRWHPEANQLYQDLQIKRGQSDALYQEYLDLYEANKERGDALWFHLRPLLIKRGIKACEIEKHPEPTAEQTVRLTEIAEALTKMGRNPEAGEEKAALALIDEALSINPVSGDYVCRSRGPMRSSAAKKYRDASEENPASGDMLFLHAMASSPRFPPEPARIDVLREGWILELPGFYLRLGLADVALEMAIHLSEWHRGLEARELARFQTGWLEIALCFSQIAAKTAPSEAHEQRIQDVLSIAKRSGLSLEDLTQR